MGNELATFSLTINLHTDTPLYSQIADQIRKLIHQDRLRCNDRLPSSRKLAQILNISRTSTLNAYEQLISEGLLVTRSTSGIYVTALASANTNSAENESENYDLPKQHESDITDSKDSIFDGGADVSLFPFVEWSRSLSRVWRQPDPVLLRKRLPGGYYPLRKAISRFVKVVRGINCKAEQVIITAGNRDAITLIAHTLLQHNDKVALENPCYPPIKSLLKNHGIDIQHCEVDSDGMRIPENKVKMSIMTPACQYPLSIIQSTERRLNWLEYSQNRQCWIIEDDFDSEFYYRRTPLATIHNMEENMLPESQRRVIVVGSFSQLMFRTLRIGYLIVPVPLIDQFISAQKKLGTMASVPVQPALADFISNKKFSTYIRRMRLQNQHRRDFIYQLIQQHLNHFFTAELPDCGTILILRKHSNIKVSDTEIEQLLIKKGLQITALSAHYHDKAVEGLILGFSGSNEDELKQGIKIIKAQMLLLSDRSVE